MQTCSIKVGRTRVTDPTGQGVPATPRATITGVSTVHGTTRIVDDSSTQDPGPSLGATSRPLPMKAVATTIPTSSATTTAAGPNWSRHPTAAGTGTA